MHAEYKTILMMVALLWSASVLKERNISQHPAAVSKRTVNMLCKIIRPSVPGKPVQTCQGNTLKKDYEINRSLSPETVKILKFLVFKRLYQ